MNAAKPRTSPAFRHARPSRAHCDAGYQLRVVVSATVGSLFLLAWGWIVAAMPARFSMAVALEMPAVVEGVTIDVAVCRDLLLNEDLLADVVREQPIAELECGDVARLRERTYIEVGSAGPNRSRVTLRVACATAEASERIGRAIVDRFLRDRPSPLPHEPGRLRLDACQAKCLKSARELADANRALEAVAQPIADAKVRQIEWQLSDTRRLITQSDKEDSALQTKAIEPAPAGSDEGESLAHSALREVFLQRQQLVANFTDKHPAVRSLDRKIDELARAVGIEDVAQWMRRRHTDGKLAAAPRMQSEIKQAAAFQLERSELHAKERELAAQLARLQAEGKKRYESAIAKCRAAVVASQKNWHDALEEKRLALAAIQSGKAANMGFCRLPELSGDCRDESPNRRIWFLSGAGISLGLCVAVGSLRSRAHSR